MHTKLVQTIDSCPDHRHADREHPGQRLRLPVTRTGEGRRVQGENDLTVVGGANHGVSMLDNPDSFTKVKAFLKKYGG